MRTIRRLKEKGDTIVEVLIAITVISFILAGGYVVTNQSLLDERQAEERSEALQLVQAQLEAARAAITAGIVTHTTNIYEPSTFCMVNGIAQTPAGSNDNCTFNSGGTVGTEQPAFNVQISYPVPTAVSGEYEYNIQVQVTWQQLGGGQNGNVTLNYRDYGDT